MNNVQKHGHVFDIFSSLEGCIIPGAAVAGFSLFTVHIPIKDGVKNIKCKEALVCCQCLK